MPQFNRIASLLVGVPGSLGTDLQNFRVSFDVKKTPSTEPNFARVEVYGLSKETRDRISQDNQVLTLRAGYVEAYGPEVLYTGDVTFVGSRIERPEVTTFFECGDGETALNRAKESLSYGSNVSLTKVLKDLLKKLALPIKTNVDLLNIKDKLLNNGFNFTGMVKDAMDTVTKELDLTWSVQNGEVKLYPREESDKVLAITINEDTGMIGSPEQIRIKSGRKDTKETKNGWRVTSYLQPKAEPGGVIILTSKLVGTDRQFRIINVQHIGDTEEGAFQTIMEVIE